MAKLKTLPQMKALSAIAVELKREIAEGDGVGVYIARGSALKLIQLIEEVLAAKSRKRDGPTNVDKLARAHELRLQSVPWREIEKRLDWKPEGTLKIYVGRNKSAVEAAWLRMKLSNTK